MTEQPPDWAIKVPSTPDVHGTITQDTGTQNPLTSVCSMLMGGSPFLGSIVNLGTGSGGGIAGSLVGGSQTLADALCGFATGTESSGATADSLLAGASDVNDSVSANNFAMGILGMGQESGSSGNLALDGIGGGLSFLTSLFGLLGVCGCSGTYDPNTVTPQDVLTGAQDVNDAVSGNPFAMGILGMGQDPSGSGNLALDGINGIQSFANSLFSILSLCGCGTGCAPDTATPQTVLTGAQDIADTVNNTPMATGILALGQQGGSSGNVAIDALGGIQQFFGSLCGIATGSTDVSATTPQTVLDTAQGYMDAGHGLLGGIGSGIDGGGLFGTASNWFSNLGSIFGGHDLSGDPALFDPTAVRSQATGTVVDDIVRSLFGWGGSDYSHQESSSALTQQTAAVLATSAQVQAMWAELHPPPPTGVSVQDLFERNASSLGGNWSETDSSDGNWSVDGHRAAWSQGFYGNTDSKCVWQGVNPNSITDYQTINVVLNSSPGGMLVGVAYNDVIGRISADKANYIRLRCGSDKSWELARFVGNTKTVMWSGHTGSVVGAGTTITLICGDKTAGALRHFKAVVGNITLVDADEVGTASLLGAGYRGYGFGGHSEFSIIGYNVPGNVEMWQAQDTG